MRWTGQGIVIHRMLRQGESMGKRKQRKPEGNPNNLRSGVRQTDETSSQTSMGKAFQKALQAGPGRIIYKNLSSANPPSTKKPFKPQPPRQDKTNQQPPKEVKANHSLPASVPKTDPAPPPVKWTRVGSKPVEIRTPQANQKVHPPDETASSPRALTPELRTKIQFHEGNPTQTRDLVIGFDFGTSCTKVVIQDVALQKAYAVPFGNLGCAQNPYLLPARVYVRPDASLSLACEGQECRNLKIDLIQNTEASLFKTSQELSDIASKHLAAGYIGLVLRQALRWFGTTHCQEYRQIRIRWQINIGLPARSYDDQSLCRLFREVAIAGWMLSAKAGEVTLSKLHPAFDAAEKVLFGDAPGLTGQEDGEFLHPDSVQAMPEVIAEVAGFVRSRLRQTGMYLLVDVGASTLDVSTFILHEREGEDIFPLLAADVRPLGANNLHLRRIQHVARSVEDFLGDIMAHGNDNAPLPELSKYTPQVIDLTNVDKEFINQCSISISSVIGLTKRKRNTRASEWDNGLPVFFCGGGAGLPAYVHAATAAAVRLRKMNVQGLERKELPKPANLDAPGLLNEHYHRLAVAYGLSFSSLDVGKIIPQHQLEDMEKEMRELDSEKLYVSKEMV